MRGLRRLLPVNHRVIREACGQYGMLIGNSWSWRYLLSAVVLELSLGADTLSAFFLPHQPFGRSPAQPAKTTLPKNSEIKNHVVFDIIVLQNLLDGLRLLVKPRNEKQH